MDDWNEHMNLGDRLGDFEFDPSNNAWDNINGELINDESNQFDFKTKLSDFNTIPSDKVWENVEEALHPKRKRRAIIWFTGVAACLIAGLFLLPKNDISKPTTNSFVEQRNTAPKTNTIVSIKHKKSTALVKGTIKKTIKPQPITKPTKKALPLIKSVQLMTPVQPEHKRSTLYAKSNHTKLEKQDFGLDLLKDIEAFRDKREKKLAAQSAASIPNQFTNDKIAPLQNTVSTTPTSNSTTTSSYKPFNNTGDLVSTEGTSNISGISVSSTVGSGNNSWYVPVAYSPNSGDNSVMTLQQPVNEPQVNYGIPISIGAGYTHPLKNPRFSVNLGVAYTYQSLNVDYLTYKVTKNNHFLSIPFEGEYKLLKKRKWSLFTSLGLQTNILLGSTQEATANNFPYNAPETLIDNQVLNVSFTFGAGIEYPISKKLSVRFQPKVISPFDINLEQFVVFPGMQAGINFLLP